MSIDLLEAFEKEDLSFVDEIEKTLSESGLDQLQLDDFKIRKMLIRKKINERQIEKHQQMFSAIKEEWQNMIQKIQKQNDLIDETILNYMELNKQKKLEFDVANVSKRAVKANFQIQDKARFAEYIALLGLDQQFLKQDLDYTKAKNEMITLKYVDVPGLTFVPEHQTLMTKFKD